MRGRGIKTVITILLAGIFVFIISCKINIRGNSDKLPAPTPTAPTQVQTEPVATPTPAPTPEPTPAPTPEPSKRDPVDYSQVQPNESGEIPIAMFHNFIADLNQTTDNEWTTSFSDFENLLKTLYDKGYRLISMRDFIDHHITVPAGKIPMVFTFDDGSPGQFNLIEKDGKLVVNPESAVGVILKFNEEHPDFGTRGIFYLNMDKEGATFEGAGTLQQRIDILLSYGFEVGNHSWGHFSFTTANDEDQVNEKLGKNEKRLEEITAGVHFYSLALPFGAKPPETLQYAMKAGEYEGVSYHNETIMAVGYLPSVPVIHAEYDPTYVRRIRAQGKTEVQFDLTYWLPLMTRDRMYISDGDPQTVVVPSGRESKILPDKLNGKELIPYTK